MNGSTRTSLDTLEKDEVPLLKDPETAQDHRCHSRGYSHFSWVVTVPWVFCFLLLVGNVVQMRQSRIISGSSIELSWRVRDPDVARKEITAGSKQVRFTGGLRYNETKHLYREIELGQVDYVGHPTLEIDSAWEELISTTDIFLTKHEVNDIIQSGGTFANLPQHDDLYMDPFTGLYQAVPTVFHDLHCLDKIRRAIYIDHYPEDKTETFWPHIQHCIDTIRQSLICTGDLTLIPEAYTPYKPNGGLEPIFQIEHTCRDFGAIQKWAKGRDALDEGVWRENAKRLKPDSFN